MHYILNDDHTISEVEDVIEWAGLFENGNRQIYDDTIGDVRISTVFLGLNHGYDPDQPPILFETMIFGGDRDQEMCRCSTYEQCESMHKTACGAVRG